MLRRFQSLRSQLTLGFIILGALPMFISGWYATSRLVSDIEADISNRNLQIAESVAGEVQGFLEEPLHVAQIISHNINENPGGDQIRSLLKQQVDFHQYLLSIFVLNDRGIVQNLYPFDRDYLGIDMSTQDFIKSAGDRGTPYWSPSNISLQTGQPSCALVLKGHSHTVVAYLNLISLRAMIERTHIGKQGYAAIIGSEGTIIAHQDWRKVQEQWNIKSHPAVAHALAGNGGSLRYGSGQESELGSVARISQTGWIVMVIQPLGEAFAPARAMRNTLFLSILIALLLGGMFVIVMLGRLLKPLDRFRESTKRVADGDYSVRLLTTDDAGSREIAELTTTFNAMIDAVHDRQVALKESEEKFEKAFRSSPDAVTISTIEEGRIIDANDGFEAILGYERSAVIGKTVFEIGLWAEPVMRGIVMHELLSSGRLRNREVSFRTRSGLLRDCRLSGEAIELGGIRCIVSIIRDITDEKKLALQLAQAQKMEAVGTLAGGIAHDFNNILSPIVGYTEMARMLTKDNTKLSEYLEHVTDAATRATDLVRQILTFSRKAEQKKLPFQASVVIKEALKLLRSSIPTTIEIRQEIASQALVLADPIQIHQIVMNLCTNAYHSMARTGGVLVVSLKETEISQEQITGDEIIPGRYIVLEVSDTGSGMNRETLDKIFEPYFTTKEQGKGTGLGLAVVHGIVKDYQGRITVQSEPGRGTTFRVYLPVTEGEKEEQPKPQAEATPTERHEHILFVDDEERICTMAKEYLSGYGYKVEVCGNGRDALFAVEQDPEFYDLLITDMSMPGMNGRELAKNVLAVRPDLPVILCTGYSSLIDRDEAAKIGIKDYIEKPVAMSELINRIKKVMSGAGRKGSFNTD